MAKKLDVKEIVEGRLVLKAFGDFESYSRVDLEVEGSMPLLHFQWLVREYIKLSAEDVNLLTEDQKLMVDNNGVCWGAKCDDAGMPIISHTWVCNFRRYAWSESQHSPTVGYGSGVTYANNIDGGLTCSSPEQVVRETLLVFMEKSRVPEDLKRHHHVRKLWQFLLEDALTNITEHACSAVNSTNGSIGRIKIGIPTDEWITRVIDID